MTLERNPKLRDVSAIAGAAVSQLAVQGNASLAKADVQALVEGLKVKNPTLNEWLEHGEPSASFAPCVMVPPIPPVETAKLNGNGNALAAALAGEPVLLPHNFNPD